MPLPAPVVSVLGRSVVVAPGAPAPPPWQGCHRVVVSALDAVTADLLGGAWRRRQPLVIELGAGLGLDDPVVPPDGRVGGRQPWEWPVDLDLIGERLHHAVWANAVDGRGPDGSWRWAWAEVAASLGARPASAGMSGDVVLPDGTVAWCDGGPLDAGLAGRIGGAVVHRIALEHGVLRPLGAPDPVGITLAPDQLAAVAEPGPGARVIAPAGSGKTRVLTERARLLLAGWGVPVAAVTLVAFNVRAAEELRNRLAEVPGVRVRTLNALGLRLCGDRTTIDEPEVRRILDDLVSLPRRAETDPAAPWVEALGRVRLGLRHPEDVMEEVGDVPDLERVTRAYRRKLADRGAVDFDEQVVAAIERLLADPAFRRRSQRHARILLVDEFQDLTPAHLLLLRLLAGPAGAVYAVGDDDQTIYGYAGATPRWLVDLGHYFPGVAHHALQVNYRCPPPVVEAAANLLSRNSVRVPKVIRPPGEPPAAPAAAPAPGSEATGSGGGEPGLGAGNGPLQTLLGAAGPAVRTADHVRRLLAGGAEPGDVAVLARVNASLAPVQVLLRHHGVPVAGGVDDRFLRRGGVRAALAWLAVAAGGAGGTLPGGALREAARHPRRGMRASLLDLVGKQRSASSLANLADWLEEKGSDREAGKVRDLVADVARVQRAASRGDTAAVLQVVRHGIGDAGLDASATALDRWSRGAIAAHGDDLHALAELADLQPEPAAFGGWLADHLRRQPGAEGVTLASVHAVKGREWPHVVLHHVTEGLMPHRLATDVEEERRVFHVGLTRGRHTVALVPGEPPSPFLGELDRPGRPDRRAAPPGAPATAPPAAGSHRAGRDAGQRPVRAGAPSELLPSEPGVVFTLGGHEHRVVDHADGGARAQLGDGPATTTVPYGTTVAAAGRPALLAHPQAEEAWERLRHWRSERAAALGKPAFVVFDDRTLRAVAAVLPATESALLAIGGIGPTKAERFGDDLLALAHELRSPSRP